jgi:hypothetical protein
VRGGQHRDRTVFGGRTSLADERVSTGTEAGVMADVIYGPRPQGPVRFGMYTHGGRRLETSKGRNRGKEHVIGGATRSAMGIGRGRATAEVSSEGR